MSVPNLTVFQNGQNQVSGDQLNTFTQTATTVANLRTFVGIQGMEVNLQGFTAPNDGGQGQFYWNTISTATDDGGVTTVVPSGVTVGAWIRLGSGSSSIVNQITNSDGSLTISPSTGNVVASLGSYGANTALANATVSSAQPTGIALTASTVLGRGTSGNIAAIPFSSISTNTGIINVQRILSTGTYTPTVGTSSVIIFAIGGGGGGGGSSTGSPTGGGTGGATSLGTLINVSGGIGGGAGSGSGGGSGGAGGAVTTATIPLTGSGGGGGQVGVFPYGGSGGAGLFGGGGSNSVYNTTPVAGGTNTGGGGGGGGGLASTANGGGGGGGGGIGVTYATGITGTYSATIGAGGTAGTGGNAGSVGGSGIIVIFEFA